MKKPDPQIEWITKKGEKKLLGKMDYNHLCNCRDMLIRGKKNSSSIYQQICEELKYRDWRKSSEKDKTPMSRFDLMDFD